MYFSDRIYNSYYFEQAGANVDTLRALNDYNIPLYFYQWLVYKKNEQLYSWGNIMFAWPISCKSM